MAGINIKGDDSGRTWIPVLIGARPASEDDIERLTGAGRMGIAELGPLSKIFKASLGGLTVAEVVLSRQGDTMSADFLDEAPHDPVLDKRLIRMVRQYAREQGASALTLSLPVARPQEP